MENFRIADIEKLKTFYVKNIFFENHVVYDINMMYTGMGRQVIERNTVQRSLDFSAG
jgi:hypothetical protein